MHKIYAIKLGRIYLKLRDKEVHTCKGGPSSKIQFIMIYKSHNSVKNYKNNYKTMPSDKGTNYKVNLKLDLHMYTQRMDTL